MRDYLNFEFNTKFLTIGFTPLEWGLGVSFGYDYGVAFNLWLGPIYINAS